MDRARRDHLRSAGTEDITGGPSGHILSGLAYLPSGQQQEINYGNGVRTTYAYDQRQRLAQLLTVSPPSTSSQQLINFSYTFDGVSNIKAIEDHRSEATVPAGDPRRNTQAFQYDDLYRLTRAQYNLPNPVSANGGQIQYHYDRIGNMLSETSDITQTERELPVANLGAMSYGGPKGASNRTGRDAGDPPGPHALTSITPSSNDPQARVFTYDPNGNMKQIDGLSCTWDFQNRLVGVEDASMRAEYRYDYTGRRIIKRVLWKQGEPPTATAASTIGPPPARQ